MQRAKENGSLQFHQNTELEMLEYVYKHATKNNPESVIKTIDNFCWTKHWMMHVGDEKGKILSDIIEKETPTTVLELGTYCGYSTIRIASKMNGKVYTIDPDIGIIDTVTKKLVEFAGLQDKIVFLTGTLETLLNVDCLKDMKFDLVFIDHAKNRYFPDLLLLEHYNLLSDRIVIVADNVIVFNIQDYESYVEKNYDTHTLFTNLEYDDGKYKDGVVISRKK